MQIEVVEEQTRRYKFQKQDGGFLRTDIIIIGDCLRKMQKGYSPIILICGKQRIGKSFVGMWLAWRTLKFFHPEKEFEPKRYSFYDPLESIYAIEDRQMEPLLIDEAGALFNKQEWYNRVTLALDKIIQTQGFLCNMYIFISPFGSDIAKTFRKHFDFIVYVRRRGVLVVKKIPKRYDDLTDRVPRPYRVEQIKLYKNVMPREVWASYEKYSMKKKKELYNKLKRQAQREYSVIKDRWGRTQYV